MAQPRPRPGHKKTGNGTQGGIMGSISRFWQRSYAADYIAWNIAYSGLLPFLILILWAAVIQPGIHKTHVTILGFLISLILTSFITDVMKNAVGRPRPDLIARCKPAKSTPEHKLVTIDVCTEQDHHTLHDGWRSFPSGHSSFAFSGLGYLALFFAGQMHVFRPRTDLARVLLSLAPLIGAALIAISRCEDYRHDVYDVTIGSILGMAIAYFSRAEYSSASGKLKDEEARVGMTREYSAEDMDDGTEHLPLRETSNDQSRVGGRSEM
ncbi:MAG: hypothetical protein LQ342_007235 [Letrouitia transgressa]|nr:MAG: hypothetical protein LQ342_007235 [Letrouitia transgressa]